MLIANAGLCGRAHVVQPALLLPSEKQISVPGAAGAGHGGVRAVGMQRKGEACWHSRGKGCDLTLTFRCGEDSRDL